MDVSFVSSKAYLMTKMFILSMKHKLLLTLPFCHKYHILSLGQNILKKYFQIDK